VKFLGYISKSTQEGSEQIDRLLSDAHFLMLPTRADCTPYVIPEANSFGLPCITTNVGGIPTMVKDHVMSIANIFWMSLPITPGTTN
jgi:glycosyltransferase involved in cell wall biosynthesis